MKLKSEYETDAYVNSEGYYVLDQSVPGEEDSSVWLSRSQAERIADNLTELLKNPVWGLEEAE